MLGVHSIAMPSIDESKCARLTSADFRSRALLNITHYNSPLWGLPVLPLLAVAHAHNL